MRIIFRSSAEKELLKLDKSLAQRIFQKIALLKDNPFGQGAQRLEREKGYRIRVGDYRVIYTIDKKERLIVITKIGHRREIYRKI